MPRIITPEKLEGVKFHVAGPKIISDNLQDGEKVDFMRTLAANISVTTGPDLNISEQIFLSDVVCSYRARADQKYYSDHITVGIRDVFWDKIVLAAKERRFSADTQIRTSWNDSYDGYAWLEASMRDKENPFYIAVKEDGENVKYVVDDVRHFFDSLKKSLLTNMLCTMRLEKQYAIEDGPHTVPWSLSITPVEIYIVSTSSYRYKQKGIDLSLCLVDADTKDTFMQLLVGGVLPGVPDSSSGEDEDEGGEEDEEKEKRKRKRTKEVKGEVTQK